MDKDFDGWSEQKKFLDQKQVSFFHNDRETWWCAVGVNVGSEEDGKGKKYCRPVLIIKWVSDRTCFMVPLTTSTRTHPLRPYIGVVDGRKAYAVVSQLRVVDQNRFVSRIGYLETEVFEEIRKTIKDML